MFKPGNLKLSIVRAILLHEGCNHIRTNGGHEIWSRKDLLRCITIQTHIDPVPGFIVQQIMRALDLKKVDMEKLIKEL